MSFESSEIFGTHHICNINYGLAIQLQSTTTLKNSKRVHTSACEEGYISKKPYYCLILYNSNSQIKC